MKAHVDRCKATEANTYEQYGVTTSNVWGQDGEIYMDLVVGRAPSKQDDS